MTLTKNKNNEDLIKYQDTLKIYLNLADFRLMISHLSFIKLNKIVSLELFDLVPKGIEVLNVITEFVFQHDKSLNAHISVYGQLNNKNLLFHFKQFKIAK